jgi:NitT/TauT family transport system substrate-binding protein
MSSRRASRLLTLLGLLLATALLASGCGGDDEATAPPAAGSGDSPGGAAEEIKEEKVTVLIDFFPNGNHALFYVARDMGFFEKEKLDVEIKHILGGAEVAKSIIAGQAQFGYADLATMAVAHSKQEADVKAIMGIQQQTPMSVLSLDKKGIKTPADLKGKKLVNFAGSSTVTVWPVFLKNNGLKESDVNVQLVDPGSLHSLVLEEKADGMVLFYTDNDPALENACKCTVDTVKFREHGIHTLSNGIIASDEYLQENPGIAERFVRAMQGALAASGEDPDAAAQALLDALPDVKTPKDVLVQNVKNTFELARTDANQDEPFGYMAAEDWDATLKLMSEAGAMDDPGDPAAYYTNDFISDSP